MIHEQNMEQYDLSEIFKNITITESLISIRALFKRDKEDYTLDYSPPYQRNYIWTTVKATYLIESILLHAEIPPIIFFEKGNKTEVVDGRQRCETIDNFLNNRLTLKAEGLDKLCYLSNKKFSKLPPDLINRFEDTKLRVISVKLNNEKDQTPQIEELVTREIFKRYNLGMTPLKKVEVFKAQYLKNPLNEYFRREINRSEEMQSQLSELFEHKAKNSELLLQHIRQLLVQHAVPIYQFTDKGDFIINKFYDVAASNANTQAAIKGMYNTFREKIFYLIEIKDLLEKENVPANGWIYDCIYWALSVCENENVKFDKTNANSFKQKLVKHISRQQTIYQKHNANRSNNTKARYIYTADFFEEQLQISFEKYIRKNEEFNFTYKELLNKYQEEEYIPGQEHECFSKVTPTSSTIMDILTQVKQNRFIIRPPYQRNEVMNIQKASYLIESILLNVKLHPIYLYLRKDGIKEVIDGQQRLLAIIGYMGEMFKNEYNLLEKSTKHCFALNLMTSVLHNLHGKRYADLPEELKKKIRKFDISVIEIREEDNKHFKPEELFKRLNYKPYPIAPNSFEYWNAYIDFDLIAAIKETGTRNKWLYLRKNDSRMLNEELITSLIFLQKSTQHVKLDAKIVNKLFSICNIHHQLSIRIKDKKMITKMLEDRPGKLQILESIRDFEADYIKKINTLIQHPAGFNKGTHQHQRLNYLLDTNTIRTGTAYYFLWLVLKGISFTEINDSRIQVLKKILKFMNDVKECHSDRDFQVVVTTHLDSSIHKTMMFAGS